MKIGVLALQGTSPFTGRRSTGSASSRPRCGCRVSSTRWPASSCPGESTTLLKLLDTWEFVPALEKLHSAGKPIFGTCAGLILLARDVESPAQFSLGLIDITAERNAYGRQKESFETVGEGDLGAGQGPLKMVFIRAPRIRRMGPAVTPLAHHRDECVMARQGSVLVASFHPELTDETKVHDYFARMVGESRS